MKHYFTKNMLDWWVKQGKPNISKFKGVTQEGDKFYFTDKDVKKEIIPLQEQDKFIADLYQDGKHGLTSAGKFYKYIVSNYAGISRTKVNEVLERIPVYQQFKPATHIHSTTKPIITHRPYERFQIDLMDFTKLAASNSNYKWILSCVDLFTKKAWAVPLKDKSAAVVADGLKQILDDVPELPHIIQSDNGLEFKGEVSELLTNKGIKQIFSSPYQLYLLSKKTAHVSPATKLANKIILLT